MTRRPGSPPPSSSHHHDRTRTFVSWTPRHIVTPLPSRTPNESSQTTKSSRIKFTREDPSRAPLLVFFPVKPRPHYMVSGRVERSVTPGGSVISRPTPALGECGSRQRAGESYIFGSQPLEAYVSASLPGPCPHDMFRFGSVTVKARKRDTQDVRPVSKVVWCRLSVVSESTFLWICHRQPGDADNSGPPV
jgi:hypothetical protein